MNQNDKKKVELLINKAIEDVAFFRLDDNRDPAKLLDVAYYLTVAQKLLEQAEHDTKENEPVNEHIERFQLQDQARQWCDDFLGDSRLDKSRKMIEKNLLAKLEKQTYDHSQAQKLWLYWVEDGIKIWNDSSLRGFDLKLRREIAKYVAEEFHKRYELGVFHEESTN